MRLLAWNIQHGGGTCLTRIVEEVSAYDPDVIAVTEFRPGVALSAAMKEMGLPHVETTRPAENENGIGSSRARRWAVPDPVRHLPRLLSIGWTSICRSAAFGIGVLHVMAAGSSKKHPTNVAKTRFWEVVLQAAEARLHEPFLFVGD